MIETLKKVPRTILAALGTTLTISVIFLASPGDSAGLKVIGEPFLSSRRLETLEGIYTFICSPVVETLPYEYKGSYISNHWKNIGEGISEVQIHIYGNQSNPKDAAEKLIYAYTPDTECSFRKVPFWRSSSTPAEVGKFNPAGLTFNLKDNEIRKKILQEIGQ